MPTLENKVALVTGGARGIGRAIAERLAADGAKVVLGYRQDAAAAAATVAAIEAHGGQALAVRADVALREDRERLFQATLAAFARLDIFVANAGHAVFGPLAEFSEADFDRSFAVNARGTFFCLQAALRTMAPGGRIVCVSTIGTLANMAGGACYFGTKAAVEQFCRVAAREAAPRGITVNLVSPGFTDTDMLREVVDDPAAREALAAETPLARLGTPGDIAGVVAFLVGPDAGWMTRQNLAVDGGRVAR
ncbi:MAG: SDR family oxidoreductase [Gammaproteobacteria bacterium]|nr:SDR family oxidoreductase [Gammaproteobacteria bacterium]